MGIASFVKRAGHEGSRLFSRPVLIKPGDWKRKAFCAPPDKTGTLKEQHLSHSASMESEYQRNAIFWAAPTK